MLRSRSEADDALDQLAQACAQFTEGYETADLKAARSLLKERG
jgi:hypothetical protein